MLVVESALQIKLGRLQTRKEISDTLHKNIKLADGRHEDYTENLIKEVLIIYERILNVPSLVNIMVEPEDRDGHNALWNSIGTLVVLASKTVYQEEM
ncbi:MAG: hypothetical protein ACKPKO_59305, partial [Candidatus Fonsibacter sp.]